jgi:hypothetical protein
MDGADLSIISGDFNACGGAAALATGERFHAPAAARNAKRKKSAIRM